MSEYSSLKATINANVKANDNHEITGSIMNSVLNAMVNSLGAGYQYIGVATPTNPGSAQTPDYRCFYIATTPGTYTNLGGLVVADGEVAILKYDTSWTKEVTGIATADQLNQLGQYVENPKWVKVVTDNDDKILYGVKTDGQFYFGAGCPPQVQEYVQAQIDSIGIDALLSTKVDKVIGESLINSDFASSQDVVESPKWLQVITDSDGKILEGISADGEKIIEVPLKNLNLTEEGINALIGELEEHGISGDAVTQEELNEQLDDYATKVSLNEYETKQHVNQVLEGYVKTTDNVNNIGNGAVTVPALSQAVQDLISAGGGGTITNNPDDVTLEVNGNNQIQIKEPYRLRGAQGTGGSAQGNARGECSTDFQLYRSNPSQVASAPYSFIAGGRENTAYSDPRMGQETADCHVEGRGCIASSWRCHAEGSRCISDGKISHSEGNGSIGSSNDGHAEGNRTVTGRIRWEAQSYGVEDAGDNLGTLKYIVISPSEGDVSAFFPNALITNEFVAAHYYQAQKDAQGNIYPSNFTPAVWNGDTLVEANDLTWALHNVCIVRGLSENDICYASIKKVVYDSSVGTKVYFVPDDDTYSGYMAIYSSYAPTVKIDGIRFGNSAHAEGCETQCTGYGAHSEGYRTKALLDGAHVEGIYSSAKGFASHAEGDHTQTLNDCEHAEGSYNVSHKARTTFGHAGNTLHSIGFGYLDENTNEVFRKNAVEVMQNGNVFIYGIGGYDGTNAYTAGVKSLQQVISELLGNS